MKGRLNCFIHVITSVIGQVRKMAKSVMNVNNNNKENKIIPYKRPAYLYCYFYYSYPKGNKPEYTKLPI